MSSSRNRLTPTGGRRSLRSLPPPRSNLLALEPRTLFDGAALVAAEQLADHTSGAHDTSQSDAHAPAVSPAEPGAADGQRHAADAASVRRELLFVDTAVAGWEGIVAGVRPGVEVIVLDPARDALGQIADRVGSGAPVDAIHIVSHGVEGTLLIGGTPVDIAALPGDASQLARIAAGLDVGADILLYGCDIGRGTTGEAVLAALALATGADVAASINATGAAAQGGDWILERQTGRI